MKAHVCFKLLIAVVAVLAMISTAEAKVHTVIVHCSRDTSGDCNEILHPNPVVINLGDQVKWDISSTCANECGIDHCSINIPEQEGYDGFSEGVFVHDINGGHSNPSPPFNNEGIYTYTVECSPGVQGTIIVQSAIPTLSEWGLIIFGVVLLGFITWAFLRRKKVIGVGV